MDVKSTNQDSLYIWLDLLGFSKEIESDQNTELLTRTLDSFRNIFCKMFEKTVYISDGILIEIDFPTSQWNINDIQKYFRLLAKGQMDFFLQSERIIRGGIGIGRSINKANWENGQFLSRGMTKAYSLESKKISWPIIGIDENVIEELVTKTGSTKEAGTTLLNLTTSVNVAGETIYFIDYAKINLEYQHTHKRKLESYFNKIFKDLEFKKDKESDKIRLKYIWLYKYFKKSWGIEIPNYKEWVL